MSQHKIRGGGGKPKTPPPPTQTPDNLRSEDEIEMVLGITEGPWRGLTNGDKSLQIGDTVLERQDGGRNFEDFKATVYPGEAFPDPLIYKLGGEASNYQVGVPTSYGLPLTRQTDHGNIDAIDIRMVVNQLYKSVETGKNTGVFDYRFDFKIRYKPLSATDWAEWDFASYMTPGSPNPHVSTWDTDWSEDSYFEDGYWYDPQDFGRSWSGGAFLSAITWAQEQRENQPGPPPSAYNGIGISGKTTSPYVKEYRIPVARIPEPYLIQIERITPDSSLSGDPKYYAEVTWESFQTIDMSQKRYPHTGFLQINAKSTDQFTSVPTISGEGDGMLVRVPTNFDPDTRLYTGIWDGQFKEAWTNSPVWLLYEAIHNDRWGWSTYTPVSWSRYEAYALAQITDFILPSGKPRYTFNAYLTEPMDGREFCRYLAGSFNSVIVDDDNGHVRVLMDKDDPAVGIFGPESIVGDFEYTYTDTNTRYNDLTVVFRNPEIDYNEDRRGIKNQDEIDQHGRIPFDFIAVGTTDANEAVRKASRRLVAATTETEMVNFKTNRKAQFFNPYDIILITDPYKGYGHAGRFKSHSGTTVTLRDPVYLEAGVNYGLVVESTEGLVERTINTGTTGFTTTLTINSALPSTVYQKAQFSVSQDGGVLGLPKPYRILDIKLDEDPDAWSIMAIEVNRLKFAAEDDATVVGEPRYSFPVEREPRAPENLKLMNVTRAAPDGTMLYEARVDFTPPSDPYVNRYFVRYRLQGTTEYEVVETDGTGLVISLPRDGVWEFQAQSRNIWNQQSLWVDPDAPVTIDKVNPIVGGNIVEVNGGLNQITIKVAYPVQTDIRYARIYEASTNNSASAVFVGRTDADTFVRTGLVGVVERWYWVKFEDSLENIGPFTSVGGFNGTTTQITAPDIQIGAITLEKFATGLTVVEIANTLPTTGNFVGRTVVLTTDGKTYTWDGTEWTTPSFDGGIESVDTLPGTATVGDVVVFEGKLYRYTSGGWTAEIDGADIRGIIDGALIADDSIGDDQIVDVGVDKLLGQLAADQLADGAVVADKIANGAIEAAKIANGAVTSDKIVDGAVAAAKIATGAITTTKIADDAITTPKLVTNAVTADKIVASAVTVDKVAANAITTAKIAAGAVVADKVAAGAITASKLFIGDTSNMVPDPGMRDASMWSGTEGSLNPTPTANGFWYIPPSAAEVYVISSRFQVEMYKPLFFNQQINMDTERTVISYIEWFADLVSATFAQTNVGNRSTPGFISGQITVPEGALYARVVTYALPGSQNVYVLSPTIRRAANGELIVDGAITADKIIANAITTAKIAANAITADKIAAKSITANKLVITSGGYINKDPFFNDPTIWFTDAGGMSIVEVADAPMGNKVLRSQVNGTNNYWQGGDYTYYPVDYLKKYRLRFWARRSSDSTGGIYADLRQFSAPGVVSTGNGGRSSYMPANAALTTSWQEFSYEWNSTHISSATKYVALDFLLNHPGWSTPGYHEIAGVRFEEMVAGELIVDGTITAVKIQAASITGDRLVANTITAGQIAAGTITATQIASASITGDRLVANTITAGQIAAGSITATQIGSATIVGGNIAADTITSAQIAANAITATEIAAGAVTAVKINVTDLSAVSANLGTITGGSLSINNRFIVASDGTVTIRNATTGARLVMTNTLIQVYDAADTLRVRLGIW